MFKNNKILIATGVLVLIFIIILVLLSYNSRYRILIYNDSDASLTVSKVFYNSLAELGSFDENFEKGEKIKLASKKSDHFYGNEYSEFNNFWIGAVSDDNNAKWETYEEFETYKRKIIDISEGLRIDYILTKDGEVKKEYWY